MAVELINPDYYKSTSIESIEVIEFFHLGFHLGNSVKYILRAGKKTPCPKEDLIKAIWYLKRFCEKHYRRSFMDRKHIATAWDFYQKVVSEFQLNKDLADTLMIIVQPTNYKKPEQAIQILEKYIENLK